MGVLVPGALLATLALLGAVQAADKNRCMDELGCFPITDDFYHPIWRAINVMVDPRETIKTTFLFYTRKNPHVPYRLIGYSATPEALKNVGFNPSLPTKMIVHGFMDTQFFGQWMSTLEQELLLVGDFNVIIVDWSGGNSLPYTQATANTRVVGAEMALLISKLMEQFNVKEDSFHLYGHSLGAQIIGYAGARHGGRLNRLTAMDAAEPYFQHMPLSVRLDPSDAQFVEAIHTDARSFVTSLGLGFKEPVGHLDFYPNGGEKMPGCGLSDRWIELKEDGLKGAAKFGACNHMKAVLYAHGLVRPKKCVPVAFRCSSYEVFQRGACYDCGADGSRCAPATYDSMDYFKRFANASSPALMYFNTAASEPYCLYHYAIQIKMRRMQSEFPSKVAPAVSGKYKLVLQGTHGQQTFVLKPTVSSLHPGSQTSLLITTETEIGDITSANFGYTSNALFLPPKMELEFLKVTPMNVVLPRSELQVYTSTLCPAGPITSRKDA